MYIFFVTLCISASFPPHCGYPCFRLMSLSLVLPGGPKVGISKWKPSCHLKEMKQASLRWKWRHFSVPGSSDLGTSVAIPLILFLPPFLFLLSILLQPLVLGNGISCSLMRRAASAYIVNKAGKTSVLRWQSKEESNAELERWNEECFKKWNILILEKP